jgi:hypothetical protein
MVCKKVDSNGLAEESLRGMGEFPWIQESTLRRKQGGGHMCQRVDLERQAQLQPGFVSTLDRPVEWSRAATDTSLAMQTAGIVSQDRIGLFRASRLS